MKIKKVIILLSLILPIFQINALTQTVTRTKDTFLKSELFAKGINIFGYEFLKKYEVNQNLFLFDLKTSQQTKVFNNLTSLINRAGKLDPIISPKVQIFNTVAQLSEQTAVLISDNLIKAAKIYIGISTKLLEFYNGIWYGAIQSGMSLAHSIRHPIETLQSIGGAAVWVSDLLLLTVACAPDEYIAYGFEQSMIKEVKREAEERLEKKFEEIANFFQGLYRRAKNSNAEDWGRFVGNLGGDLIFPSATAKGIKTIAKAAKIELLTAKVANLTQKVYSKLKPIEKLELAIEAPHNLILFEALEATKEITQTSKTIRESCIFLEGWLKENAHIKSAYIDPLLSELSMNKRIQSLCAAYANPKVILDHLKQLKDLTQKYYNKVFKTFLNGREYAIEGKFINPRFLELDHWLIADFKIRDGIFSKFNGGHCYDLIELEKSNLIKIISKEHLGLECYKVKLSISGKVKTKTYGPWRSYEKYMEKVVESFGDIIKGGTTNDGYYQIFGKTKEGIILKTILDVDCKVMTSYVCEESMIKMLNPSI